jgi:hypothetical protein
MSGDLLAEPFDRSLVGAEKAGQAQQQSRLPCPGPADYADNLSTADVETDVTESWR